MTLYDEFRYPGKFYSQASIERMAMLATLYGLAPPTVQRCRSLELGCGEGGHLIPLAYAFPEAEFLGVDLSEASIERAQSVARQLGLKNLHFEARNLAEFPKNAGSFDYIVAHGLFSWVPPAIQEKLLEICGRHLSARGVAYVSYNTYPAGHLRRIPRDLVLFHTRHISDPAAKVREARSILDFVISAMPENMIEQALLKREAGIYRNSDAFLFFDLLAETNDPAYFFDFIDQSAGHGLQFLAESDIQKMRTARLSEDARHRLDLISDRLLREQYLDFILGRGFRNTLLCHAGHDLDLDVTPARMEQLLISSSLRPVQPVRDVTSPEVLEFRDSNGDSVSTAEALPKAVYLLLGDSSPHPLPYTELRDQACRRAEIALPLEPAVEAKLVRTLVSSFANGVVEFHVYQPPFCSQVSAQPLASVVARYQAQAGLPVTSMLLRAFGLESPLLRKLLLLLDGTRDHDALERDLPGCLSDGDRDDFNRDKLQNALSTLADYALLIA